MVFLNYSKIQKVEKKNSCNKQQHYLGPRPSGTERFPGLIHTFRRWILFFPRSWCNWTTTSRGIIFENNLGFESVNSMVRKYKNPRNIILIGICSLKTFGHGSWSRYTKPTSFPFALSWAYSLLTECSNWPDIVGPIGNSIVYHVCEVSITRTSGPRWKREPQR